MANPENICVGCESPLVRGQRYGVRRGQLWHSHCYTAFGGRTRADREMERKIARVEQGALEASLERDRERLDADQNRRRAADARADLELALRANVRTLERVRDGLRKDLAAARDTNTMLANDLATAQRELAASRVVAAATPPPAAKTETEAEKTPETDDYTGIKERFSLLELD
jgi:hypothetical protein